MLYAEINEISVWLDQQEDEGVDVSSFRLLCSYNYLPCSLSVAFIYKCYLEVRAGDFICYNEQYGCGAGIDGDGDGNGYHRNSRWGNGYGDWNYYALETR